jgi:hypothetical protein
VIPPEEFSDQIAETTPIRRPVDERTSDRRAS